MAKKIDCTLSEKRPIASANASDSTAAAMSPSSERAPARAQRVEHEANAVGADAEEHHMRERDDAGIAEQQIIGRGEQDHHAGLGGDVERLGAGEQERRQRQSEDDERRAGSAAPARAADRRRGCSSPADRVEPARAPQQHRDHRQDVRHQRELRGEKAGVIGDERDQDRGDERAADRA